MDTVGRGIVAGFIAMLMLSGLLDSLVMLTRSIWSPAQAASSLLVQLASVTVASFSTIGRMCSRSRITLAR
jgi:hypothetical protein